MLECVGSGVPQFCDFCLRKSVEKRGFQAQIGSERVKIGSEMVKIRPKMVKLIKLGECARMCQNVVECAHMWWNEQFSTCWYEYGIIFLKP